MRQDRHKKPLEQFASQGAIQLGASATLVSAQELVDSGYKEHQNLQAQLAMADMIVATKTGLHQDTDLHALNDCLLVHGEQNKPQVSS
ncbi:GTP-binding protein [Agarivorans sp. MS3-6]|uniref:GTP-binding protein n=1 Tax=Agarivorans sp. TSD2052 TaxID=2937286 RepID=UPI00200BCF6F|nr:GTP-binding protein [Agarivorans sp. TSD2052]UPW17584.1 hypothetical protein M0C34_15245 [Agarivorans sp. TSD2052]